MCRKPRTSTELPQSFHRASTERLLSAAAENGRIIPHARRKLAASIEQGGLHRERAGIGRETQRPRRNSNNGRFRAASGESIPHGLRTSARSVWLPKRCGGWIKWTDSST